MKGRGVLVAIGLLLLWQAVVMIFHIPDYLVPSVPHTFATFWHEPVLLWQQTWPTLVEALVGFAVAVLWGVMVAILMSLFAPVRFWLLPIIVVSQAIPTFAVAPILVIWLGYGLSSKIAVIVLVLFFPVAATFYDGLCRTPAMWEDLAQVYQANRWRRLRYVRLPAALPALASGLRMAAAWAPMAAVVAEWVGASRGLGFLMLLANARVDMPLMFAALLIIIVISLGFYGLVSWALTRLIAWTL